MPLTTAVLNFAKLVRQIQRASHLWTVTVITGAVHQKDGGSSNGSMAKPNEFYLRNVKAKLSLTDQNDLYYSAQLHLKRQNRDILSGEKGLLSLARAVQQLEPLSGLSPPGLVLFSLPRNDTGNDAMHLH